MQALLDASRAENQKLTDAQLLRLQRLERDLLLSQKDRRVREALEYAISVIRGSENTAHEGGTMSRAPHCRQVVLNSSACLPCSTAVSYCWSRITAGRGISPVK